MNFKLRVRKGEHKQDGDSAENNNNEGDDNDAVDDAPTRNASLHSKPTLGRKTLAPSTQHAYTLAANKNLEYFGASAPLAELRNGTVKKYVDALKAEKLEAVTINRRIFVLDAVIKGVRDADGECIFKQTLDADYLALPLQEQKQQPCATRAELRRA